MLDAAIDDGFRSRQKRRLSVGSRAIRQKLRTRSAAVLLPHPSLLSESNRSFELLHPMNPQNPAKLERSAWPLAARWNQGPHTSIESWRRVASVASRSRSALYLVVPVTSFCNRNSRWIFRLKFWFCWMNLKSFCVASPANLASVL